MAVLKDIVIDCTRPAALARFWAAALDGYALRPYDEAEIERLQSIGINDVEDDPAVVIDSTLGLPSIFFQRVPEPKTAKNRLHLDTAAADRESEVRRLAGLGATVFRELDEGGSRWTVMRDPDGNEFCVMER
jgi:hypothetical protein